MIENGRQRLRKMNNKAKDLHGLFHDVLIRGGVECAYCYMNLFRSTLVQVSMQLDDYRQKNAILYVHSVKMEPEPLYPWYHMVPHGTMVDVLYCT